MDIGKQLKSLEGYDGPSMTDIKNHLKRIESCNGSTVVLLVEDSARAAELGRIIAQAGNLPHVKVVHTSELDGINGRKLSHFAVDEVDHLYFEVDSSLAPLLNKMRERTPEDFRREMMSVPVAGDKIEQEKRAESRGKWKGRRAIERGWRR